MLVIAGCEWLLVLRSNCEIWKRVLLGFAVMLVAYALTRAIAFTLPLELLK